VNPADKPHAPATERNRDAILEVLADHFGHPARILEIGSGTGQHAVYFAQAFPHLNWQCSDRAERLDGIQLWLAESALHNTPPPLDLDVAGTWPEQQFDAVFSANTLHIMSWPEVESMFAGLRQTLKADGKLLVYGPFNYHGAYTSDSNREFDQSLRAEEPSRGIRDFEAVDALAQAIGLRLIEDRSMPANNRCLVWQRVQDSAKLPLNAIP
jgi:cyclopropane fatty-acyl-phospholipid synthase-like methyltransferase